MSLDAANQALAHDMVEAVELEPASPTETVRREPSSPAIDPALGGCLKRRSRPRCCVSPRPNILVMITQASFGLVETYFAGWLDTDALAASR